MTKTLVAPKKVNKEKRLTAADIKGICKSLIDLSPQKPDPESIRALVGDYTFKTLPEVAAAFGVSANTVGQSWRQNGLPGQQGNYPAVDVLLWRLERNLAEQERYNLTGDEIAKRLKQIELNEAELALASQIRKDELERGLSVPVEAGRQQVARVLAVLRQTFSNIPRQLQVAYGEACASEADKMIRNALQAAHDGIIRVAQGDL